MYGQYQDRPKTCGRPGQAINLAPLEADILKTFDLEQGWRIFSGHVPKLRILVGEILSSLENLILPSTVFPIIPVMS